MSRFVRGQVGHVAPIDVHAAVARLFEAGKDAQGRGLAAARGAQQHHELAVLDLEREVGERDDLAEALADRVEQHAHAGPPITARSCCSA